VELSSEEYKSLRDEMLNSRKLQIQISIAGPTISLAYVGIMIKEKIPEGKMALLLLPPIALLICTMLFVYERRFSIFRIAKYIKVFHRHLDTWEQSLEEFHDAYKKSYLKLIKLNILNMTILIHTILFIILILLSLHGVSQKIPFRISDYSYYVLHFISALLFFSALFYIITNNRKLTERINSVWEKVKKGKFPKVTVDIIAEMEDDKIVLIKRKYDPIGYALPGGFVDYGETVEEAAKREAKEELNIEISDLRQFKVYSDPKRDSRWHTISVVFIAKAHGVPKPGSDAAEVKIFNPLENQIELVFDHSEIIRDYLNQRQ
jgi:8-oxo-dGTP diphosphatase